MPNKRKNKKKTAKAVGASTAKSIKNVEKALVDPASNEKAMINIGQAASKLMRNYYRGTMYTYDKD